MTGVDMVGLDTIAPAIDGVWLLGGLLFVVAGHLVMIRRRRGLAPPRPGAAVSIEKLRSDSPAVVNMLANDATVTAAGFRATMIDLAARGWLRILPPGDDDELARIRPAAEAAHGDSLRPHERLVLQHVVARFTTDRAIPARYLAVDIRGTWWRRFAGLVALEATDTGLVTRRWRPGDLGVPVALGLAAFGCWLIGARNASNVAVIDSIDRRVVGWVLLAAVVVLVVRIVGVLVRPLYTLTNEGVGATQQWLAVRRLLDHAGFGDLAPSAQEVGDRRLAYATAMCVAEGSAIELPLAREDHHRAWSSVGGRARLVRVEYPSRVGFGMASTTAMVTGAALFVGGLWLRWWFDRVAREEAFAWIYDQLSSHADAIADVAIGLEVLSFVPIVIGLWLVVAGILDLLSPAERTGVVVRARRPVEVSGLPRRIRRWLDRDRYRVYLAVDDGSTDTIMAWRASERTAVPQGARATVKASAVLGRVRSSTPVGHRLDIE
jgi:hypothetical protein